MKLLLSILVLSSHHETLFVKGNRLILSRKMLQNNQEYVLQISNITKA